jgi:peptidoglycan/xylan/chitin deacetylase (PgdA/CDA1 family)
VPGKAARPPLVLAYHGVADVPRRRDTFKHFVSPRALSRHISMLLAWGYALVTLGELALSAATGQASGLAALTFDDGFADNFSTLLPLLREKGVPATVFVVSGWLGGPHPHAPDHRILTAGEVAALHDAGVEIGAHTVTHPRLGRLPQAEVLAEMATSKADLEKIVQAPVTSFSYPFGDATPETAVACAEAGFTNACLTSGVGDWQRPFELPREGMINGTSRLGLWLRRDRRYERLVRRRGVRRVYALACSVRGMSVPPLEPPFIPPPAATGQPVTQVSPR